MLTLRKQIQPCRMSGPYAGVPQPRPQMRVRHTARMSDPLRNLLAAPPDLPVTAGLAALDQALRTRGVALVHAPPGTGKTTLVPPTVADVVSGRVVATQPSRIAARAAARRLAHLLGEPVGETVGYSVRGDRRSSRPTRVEIVTTGLLLRRIQQTSTDPRVQDTVTSISRGVAMTA